jgi:uncharacterized Zn-finger protein
VYIASPYTKAEEKHKHRCNACGIEFESAEQLSTHNRLEHSSNAHSPAGIA